MEVPAEPQVAEYLALLHQAASARAALRAATFLPQYCLPFLQPGRVVRLLTAAPGSGGGSEGAVVVIDPEGRGNGSATNGSGRSRQCWADPAVWGVIINFERLGSAKKGARF